MRLSEVTYTDSRPIDGYGPGFFRIGGEIYRGPVLILPTSVSGWTGYGEMEPILASVAELDVLFIGTGAETAHPPAAFRQTLEGTGIGVEAMASPSACRTYNVLLSEGRRIGAGLLPV